MPVQEFLKYLIHLCSNVAECGARARVDYLQTLAKPFCRDSELEPTKKDPATKKKNISDVRIVVL